MNIEEFKKMQTLGVDEELLLFEGKLKKRKRMRLAFVILLLGVLLGILWTGTFGFVHFLAHRCYVRSTLELKLICTFCF
jgi:hypothetical protein